MKLLFLTSRFPYPPISGERLRVFHLLHSLSKRFAVTLISEAPESMRDVEELRRRIGSIEVHAVRHTLLEKLLGALSAGLSGLPLQVGYFRNSRIRRLVANCAAGHDVVVCHLIRRAEDGLRTPSMARVLDMCDAISENYRQTAEHGRWWSPWTWISASEHGRVARFEKRVLRAFDLVSMATSADADRVGLPSGLRLIATNGVSLRDYRFTPPPHNRFGVALVGKMDFYPNYKAAEWFAHEVLPRLSEPVFLKIIGDCSSKRRRTLESLPRVTVTGRVSSIQEACEECFAGVAPMQVATGVQTKALEYFAMGLPSVVSPTVARGFLPQSAGTHVVADSAVEWAAAIDRIQLRGIDVSDMARAARRYVETHHNWELIGEMYCKAVENLLVTRRRIEVTSPRI